MNILKKKGMRLRHRVDRIKPLSATELDSRERFSFGHPAGEMKQLQSIKRRLILKLTFFNILLME
jgi:hypothetical protein